jgi:hypothetical protein
MIETVDTLARRVSALVSIRRARQDDARREETHGGSSAELVARLRTLADDLEKSIR